MNCWNHNTPLLYEDVIKSNEGHITHLGPIVVRTGVPTLQAIPEVDGTNSETFILLHLSRRLALIGGTFYAGEIKKSVFTVLNYLLPQQQVLPMHCSANIGPDDDTLTENTRAAYPLSHIPNSVPSGMGGHPRNVNVQGSHIRSGG